MAYISKITPLGSTTTYDLSALKIRSFSTIGSSSTDHATALKNFFDNNKTNTPRNELIHFYDGSQGNGSASFGYFLSGYDTTPYGGFFVAHYNNPYYVGIQSGSYVQQHLLTSTNYTSYTVTKAGSGASGTWEISITGNSATATKTGIASMWTYSENNNELNFGGTNNSSTIYLGYRAKDSKPIPTKFIFGSSTGTADLQAKTVYLGSGTTSYISSTNYTGNAATVTVTKTTPTNTTTYYPVYTTSTTTGAQSLRNDTRFYYYDTGTTSYLNIGNTSNSGGLTLHNANGKYGDIVSSAFTANRTFTLPDKTGTFALTSDLSSYLPIYYSNLDYTSTAPVPGAYTVNAQTHPVTGVAEYGSALSLPGIGSSTKHYAAQLLISSPSGQASAVHGYIRRLTSTPAWSNWSTLLDDKNFDDYTVKKSSTDGATSQVAYYTAANTIGGSNNFTWDATNNQVTVLHKSGKGDGFRTYYGTSVDMFFGIGSGDANHGIYDSKASKWMIYADANGNVTVNGNSTTATKATQDSDGNAINTTYLKKSGGNMTGNLNIEYNKQIVFYGKNNNTSPRAIMGYTNSMGGIMHCENAANHQTSGAFYISSNGCDGANDNGGIAIDNEGVTVFGAGDPGNNFTGVFRVINEDSVGTGPVFTVKKAGACYFGNGQTHYISNDGSQYTGNAATATALTTNAGSATQPVYFSNGKPVTATAYANASVNYANSAGSANSVAWANISGKPINFKAYSGALNSGGWNALNGNVSGANLSIAYNNNAASWNSGTYSASLVFGCNDTKGLLDLGYNSPIVTFGGASNGGSTNDNPKWYFKLSGTSGQTYTFPTTSKTLVATDGTGASGTWGISISGKAATAGTADSANAVAWGNVTGKPSTFPPSTHTHYELATIGDQRSTATTPNTYANRLIFQGLKTNTQIGSPSNDTYSYIVGLRGWSDSSGGNSHELAFNNTGFYHRSGATTSWGDWEIVGNIKWNAVTQGQKWSRICLITPKSTTEGSSGILSISCTRGSVVVNNTFMVTTAHAGSKLVQINQLGGSNYSSVKIRGVCSSNGTSYIELYDTANSIASGTTQTWHCSYKPLLNSQIIVYTAFTDGTTIPSGYAAYNELTTFTGDTASAIVNISRSGTTFTATRQNGSTFTFTQQDNNSVTGVKGSAESNYRTGNVNITASNIGLGNVTNDAQIPKSIGTTKGDIIYWSAGSTPARLGIGSNGKVLKVVSGVPAWGDVSIPYGETLPSTGTNGDVFLQTSAEYYELPTGGTTGQLLAKSSNTDRAVHWVDAPPSTISPSSVKFYPAGSTVATTNSNPQVFNTAIYVENNVLFGAAWNDYAEFRKDNPIEKQEPGRCVRELGDGTLALTTQRLERGCEIISNTFGFAIGQDEKNGYNTPIASSGRVLAYPYESIEEFSKHIGWPVCSGPSGTVSIMTEEEEEKYPSRIIGTISEIPTYKEWGASKIPVNGRIWIRIK